MHQSALEIIQNFPWLEAAFEDNSDSDSSDDDDNSLWLSVHRHLQRSFGLGLYNEVCAFYYFRG